MRHLKFFNLLLLVFINPLVHAEVVELQETNLPFVQIMQYDSSTDSCATISRFEGARSHEEIQPGLRLEYCKLLRHSVQMKAIAQCPAVARGKRRGFDALITEMRPDCLCVSTHKTSRAPIYVESHPVELYYCRQAFSEAERNRIEDAFGQPVFAPRTVQLFKRWWNSVVAP